jgi:hypothetical protein
VVFSAYNDVTLTTSTNIYVGGYTLNVTGSSAVIESITVGASNFSVTLGNGSSIKVSSAGLQELTPSSQTGVSESVCTDSESSITLAYSGVGTITNTITPESTQCDGGVSEPEPTPTPSSSGSSGSRSRNTNIVPTAPIVVPNCPVGFVCTPVQPITTPIQTPTTNQNNFTRSLTVGNTGPDVKSLQQYLNSKGFFVAISGPGSPGNETEKFGALTRSALARFQSANGISPAIGFFGPITRSFIQNKK